MKFQKILSIGIADGKLEPQFWNRIDALSRERVILQKDSMEISKHLSGADCLLVNPFSVEVNKEMINAAPNLKYIGGLGTAYGKIDTAYAASKRIVVCNVPGYATESVAELAFGIILEFIRDLEFSKQQTREGNFSDMPRFPVYEIKGKKFGVIGLGRIGSRIAELALAFGAEVFYWSEKKKSEAEAAGIKFKEIDKLLSECDFISINLSLNKQTENFLNERRIEEIKSKAVLLNLAPNELVDFSSLEKRLARGNLTYIADHSDEMTAEQVAQLSKYKNCILYPPIGYQTKEAAALKQEIFVSNIENFLRGEPTNKVR